MFWGGFGSYAEAWLCARVLSLPRERGHAEDVDVGWASKRFSLGFNDDSEGKNGAGSSVWYERLTCTDSKFFNFIH